MIFSRPAKSAVVLLALSLSVFLPQITPAAIQPEADLSFGLNLFRTVCKDNAGSNVVVSPSSAFTVLALAAYGANGTTQEQMLKTLGVNGALTNLVQVINRIRYNAKAQKPGVTIESANAVFANKNVPMSATYTDAAKQIFDAEAHNDNFSDPATLKKINDWCSTHTHGKISKILETLDENNLMVLINAIYFKGKWESQFKPANTAAANFKSDAKSETVKMMHQEASFPYFAGPNFTSICMPYTGNEIKMYLFLPNKGVALSTFQEQLTVKNWQNWMSSYSASQVKVGLPKFKIAFTRRLNPDLKKLNMTDAFSEAADFSKMFKNANKAFIGLVLQKTFIDVNEEGAEAAAVTVVGVEKGMYREEDLIPKSFVVDRPFAFALTNSKTNQLLFLGSVTDPLKM